MVIIMHLKKKRHSLRLHEDMVNTTCTRSGCIGLQVGSWSAMLLTAMMIGIQSETNFVILPFHIYQKVFENLSITRTNLSLFSEFKYSDAI